MNECLIEMAEFFIAETNDKNLSERLIGRFVEVFGGNMLYVPKSIRSKTEIIKNEFTGNNHRTLAKKHNITVRHVRKITAKN